MSVTRVVLGVLIDGPRIMLAQRRRDAELPWSWGCPGGKVEGDESDREALAREWKEEVGLDVAVGAFVCAEDFGPPVLRSRCHVAHYLVRATGKPMPIVEEGLGWFRLSEVPHLQIVPSLSAYAMEEIVAALRHEMRGYCNGTEKLPQVGCKECEHVR